MSRGRKNTQAKAAAGLPSDKKKAIRKYIGKNQKMQTIAEHFQSDPKYKNKVLGWFNDEGGEIHRKMQIGWTPVQGEAFQSVWNKGAEDSSQKTSYVTMNVGMTRHSDSTEAVLMCIDKDIYEEIKAVKQEDVHKIERSLKGGKTSHLGNGEREDSEDLQTYAPYTGVGNERGYSEQPEVVKRGS